jgi:hypothetical protein
LFPKIVNEIKIGGIWISQKLLNPEWDDIIVAKNKK